MADQPSNCATYCVIPLSIQPEGEDFLVGNQDLQEYYQFPHEGVRIIRLLQQGATVGDIKRAFGDAVDIDDFLNLLLEARFIHAPDAPPPAPASDTDRRWKFAVPARIAGLFFSWPAWGAYCTLIAYALAEAVLDPRLRINPTALYLQDHFTISLLTLLVLHSCATGLHELGHMMAAARYGVQSRLGWGNRLWNIVAEADLSGLHALPRQSRYLPLMAGMLVDILNIALITLLIKLLIHEGSHPFIINIFQALILQILITLSWQFNVFLKTDIYYVLCTYCNYPNLDSEARIYLREKLYQFSLGRAGAPGHTRYYHLPTLRAFAAVWVAGRIASLAFLFLVVIPTLLRYGRDAWNALGSAASASSQWDLSLFFILSASLLAAGLIVWLRGRARAVKEN
jgi:putative peptide zinc metalloprotease protein